MYKLPFVNMMIFAIIVLIIIMIHAPPLLRIHVRRTDKVGTEASFHSLEEYMRHVDEYYLNLSLKQHVPVRRVYLASDDPNVLPEARRKWV